MNRLFN